MLIYRDLASGATLFEICKPPGQGGPPDQPAEGDDPNVGRFVRYQVRTIKPSL